jgi:hypothetical protein
VSEQLTTTPVLLRANRAARSQACLNASPGRAPLAFSGS